MEIDRKKLLDLWTLTNVPLCDDGMELAAIMIERCIQTVFNLKSKSVEEFQDKVIGQRDSMIRAHRDLVLHRGDCPKCMK
jgi:hypothetical protein